jgi:serine protease Do
MVDELTPMMAKQIGVPSNSGIVVTDLEEGSLAEASGMQPGDIILEVNRQPVPTLAAYQQIVEPIKPTDLTLLLINRQGTVLFVPILGE